MVDWRCVCVWRPRIKWGLFPNAVAVIISNSGYMQMFINTVDSPELDKKNFMPFGKVSVCCVCTAVCCVCAR